MIVLLKGRTVTYANFTVICQKCRATLQGDVRDIELRGDGYVYYRCPCCGMKNRFKKEKLPRNVEKDILFSIDD